MMVIVITVDFKTCYINLNLHDTNFLFLPMKRLKLLPLFFPNKIKYPLTPGQWKGGRERTDSFAFENSRSPIKPHVFY